MTAEDFAHTKIVRKRKTRACCTFPAIFFADCHHQELLWPLMQPGTLRPAEHRPHTCPTPGAVGRRVYSHEGPAQVDGCAAPIHWIIQDVEGEAGHFCFHQDAEVITCRANRGFLVRLHEAESRRGLWHSDTLPVPRSIPAGEAEQRQTRSFAADFQAEKTATNRLAVYSVSLSFSRNGSLPTRKVCALQ